MSDKLDNIFERQLELDSFITAQRERLEWDVSEKLQHFALALMVETTELVAETNYKWWKNKKPLNMDAIREELVDILHFFVSMCNTAGMDADKLFELYMKKNQENYDRQKGLSNKEGYKSPK